MAEGALELRSQDKELNAAVYAEQIQQEKIKGLQNVIGTNNEILLMTKNPEKLLDQVSKIKWHKRKNKTWTIPVCFDQCKDWKDVEAITGYNKRQYLKRLKQQTLKVSMLGFIPGFVYLEGLSRELRVPRKKIPEKNVQGKVLAVGGPYMGIYSLPSPSGWRIIGKIPVEILEMDNNPPLAFSIHDDVQLKFIDQEEYEDLSVSNISLTAYNG